GPRLPPRGGLAPGAAGASLLRPLRAAVGRNPGEPSVRVRSQASSERPGHGGGTGMIFELVQDLADVLEAMPAGHPRRRLLTLLDEAVRRDVHFIARRPTALFQCLWNSCWWYDCPEAAGRRETPGESAVAEGPPPWETPALAPLLEAW